MHRNHIALIAAVALSVFTVGGCVRAQSPAAGGQRAGLFASLNLTPTERQQIKPVMLNLRSRVQAIKGNTSLTPEQQKAQIAPLRRTAMTQIFAFLTPTQQAQLKAELQARRHGAGTAGAAAGTSASTAPAVTPQTGGNDL